VFQVVEFDQNTPYWAEYNQAMGELMRLQRLLSYNGVL
jgi:hypothetical protein